MFTPTVTISLDQYNQMKEAIYAAGKTIEQLNAEAGKTIEQLNAEVLEAQQASRAFLNSVFTVEYVSNASVPTLRLNYVPGLVAYLNELLAANPTPTGAIYKVRETYNAGSSYTNSEALLLSIERISYEPASVTDEISQHIVNE